MLVTHEMCLAAVKVAKEINIEANVVERKTKEEIDKQNKELHEHCWYN